jgi:hypothetical protein
VYAPFVKFGLRHKFWRSRTKSRMLRMMQYASLLLFGSCLR